MLECPSFGGIKNVKMMGRLERAAEEKRGRCKLQLYERAPNDLARIKYGKEEIRRPVDLGPGGGFPRPLVCRCEAELQARI